MITVESTVGALVELRFIGSPRMNDALEFEAKTATLVKRIVKSGKRRAILCTDLRAGGVLAPDVSARIVWLMRQDNPHVERNAFFAKDSAVLSLQVQRVISEAGERNRRQIFDNDILLTSWLSEVTTPDELARLRVFLASGPLLRK
jgi:hypothetical protein